MNSQYAHPIISCIAGMTFALWTGVAGAQDEKPSYEEYLRKSAVPREVLDVFLDPSKRSWAQFDSELGYILGRYMPRDGVDGSSTISTVQKNGARASRLYTDRPCRINTYGNSFTLCHQVSDGETWQEYLAAHLGEPVRNFGMGGYGVYQTYRRMLREEQTDHAADYLIFYIYGDDHLRTLLRCRYASYYLWWDHKGGTMFHNNFWPYVDIDLKTGQIQEHENMLPTPESVYQMTDGDWMARTLRDDLALQMYVYVRGSTSDIDVERVRTLAQVLGMDAEGLDKETPSREAIRAVLNKYGFAATRYIVTKASEFAQREGKEFMVALFDPSVMRELIEKGTRYDQEIVDFLKDSKIRTFDMNVIHVKDYERFKLSFNDYRKRYFIGHYSPAGNHFFAYSIKNSVVDWLEPKPITYQAGDQKMITFEGYLQD